MSSHKYSIDASKHFVLACCYEHKVDPRQDYVAFTYMRNNADALFGVNLKNFPGITLRMPMDFKGDACDTRVEALKRAVAELLIEGRISVDVQQNGVGKKVNAYAITDAGKTYFEGKMQELKTPGYKEYEAPTPIKNPKIGLGVVLKGSRDDKVKTLLAALFPGISRTTL
jgi:hypothetical protein